jgi:hypothetical protein
VLPNTKQGKTLSLLLFIKWAAEIFLVWHDKTESMFSLTKYFVEQSLTDTEHSLADIQIMIFFSSGLPPRHMTKLKQNFPAKSENTVTCGRLPFLSFELSAD